MLAPYVRFVLIDRTMEDIQAARARYGLSEAQCVCVDLRFWEIYEEEERFFETLLANGGRSAFVRISASGHGVSGGATANICGI